MQDPRRSKVDLSRVKPETFQRAGHTSLVRGAGAAAVWEGAPRQSPSDLQGHLLGPPGFVARADSRAPQGPRNPSLRSRSPAPASRDRAPALRLERLQTDPPASETSPHSSRRRSRSRRPRAARPPPSNQLLRRLGRPLTFSSPCQWSWSPWCSETPDTWATRPVGVAGAASAVALANSSRPRPVLNVPGDHRSRAPRTVRWKFAGGWVGAGEEGGER